MKHNVLPKKVLYLWLVRGALGAIPTLAAFLTAVFLCEGAARLAVALFGGAALLISLFFMLGLPALRFARYTYGYDEKRITVCRGVIFRKKIVIPLYQIQDLHKTEGPLMMLFGLAGVSLSTAGSAFSLATLEKEAVDRMINELESLAAVRFEENRDEAL